MVWDGEALTEPRVAVARRDITAIRAAVDGRDLDTVLQLTGDGLLVDPADPLTRECAELLRRRGWTAIPSSPTHSRAVPATSDRSRSTSRSRLDPRGRPGPRRRRIDLSTGDVLHGSPYDDHADDEELDDEGRWLWVEASSRAGWWDMSEFTETVDDPALADRLQRAIQGSGAFRAFATSLPRTRTS